MKPEKDTPFGRSLPVWHFITFQTVFCTHRNNKTHLYTLAEIVALICRKFIPLNYDNTSKTLFYFNGIAIA